MKYLLTFVRDQDRMYGGTEEEMKAAMEAWMAFDAEAIEAGVLIANQPLEHPSEARTIRFAEDGAKTVTDGPFAETKEQLGGFCLIECESLEEAIEWGKKVPLRADSKVEVRQVKDLSPFGYESKSPGPIQAVA